MRKIIFTAFALIFGGICYAQLNVQDLLTENLANPICIDVKTPRFNWKIVENDKHNVMQTAYEIKVSSGQPSAKGKSQVWSSGKIFSDQSMYIPYVGTPLKSGQRYFWHVRVWDNDGKTSGWSETAWWQMGLLNQNNWTAKWITPGYTKDSVTRPSPLFRKSFHLNKKVKCAVAYITAHGFYEALINGYRVGDAFLTPGWTSYNKRLQYQAYDVTSMLQKGDNAVAAVLGSGWYRGHIGYEPTLNLYGKDIALLFQLQLTYDGGTTEKIISDGSLKSATGAIRYSELTIKKHGFRLA